MERKELNIITKIGKWLVGDYSFGKTMIIDVPKLPLVGYTRSYYTKRGKKKIVSTGRRNRKC